MPQAELSLALTDERIKHVLRVLERAVAKACPAELHAMRDDLVQSALLRVLELGEESEPRPASYLWRVAFSVVVDELRRLRRRHAMNAGLAGERQASSRPELAMAIRDCLAGLLEPRQLAVMLHLQGYGSEQASGILGWDVKRVRNLVFRGMTDLRRCLLAKGFP